MADQAVRPGRLKFAKAASYLDLCTKTLGGYVSAGVFTVQLDSDAVTASRYLLVDELDVWLTARGDIEARCEAVRRFRFEKGRIE